MMKLRSMLLSVVLSLASLAASAQDKVVYHVSDAATQALAALRNVRNHLDTDPTAKITVVTHAAGVDFLMEGAKDRTDVSYDALVSALKNRGVAFEVCEITRKREKPRPSGRGGRAQARAASRWLGG